jgi:hypothetical protein
VRALAANGEALAVTQAAVAAQVHQALDIHRNFTTEVTLYDVIAVDGLANLENLSVGELVHPAIGRDADALADFVCELGPDPMDVLKRNQNALLRRDIHTSYTSHVRLLEASSSTAKSGDIHLLFNEKTRTELTRAKIATRTNPSVSSS